MSLRDVLLADHRVQYPDDSITTSFSLTTIAVLHAAAGFARGVYGHSSNTLHIAWLPLDDRRL